MKAHSVLFLMFMITRVGFCQSGDSLKTHLLAEVVVDGVRTEGDTLQNFYKANSNSTTETILSRMKGVSLMRRGSFGQEPVFRGLVNGQLNITIDGMKMFGACTDRMDPVTIYVEPANLSVVQSILGPQGSEFGSTIGGTLNMKLAQPIVGRDLITGTSGVDFQSNASAFSVFSTLNVSKATSAYRGSVVFRNSNNYHDGSGKEIRFSQYRKVNLSFSGKWTLAKYDTLQADVLLDKGTNIGFPALTMDVGSATAGIYSVNYQHVVPWFIFHKVKAKAYYNIIAHSMDDTKRDSVPIHMDMPGKSSTAGVFVDMDVHVFHEHQTLLKLEYFRNELVGEMTMYPEEGQPMYMQTAPQSSRQDFGVFLSQQLRLNSKNKFLFTFRGDLVADNLKKGIGGNQLHVFYPALNNQTSRFLKTFSANYRKNIGPSLMLEINAGYGERFATLNERFGFYLYNRFDGYDYIGNAYLKPEASTSIDVSLNYLSSTIEVQLSPFYQRIQNFILGSVARDASGMTIGARGVKVYHNYDRAELKGLDLMFLAKPVNNIQVIASLKYTYGTLEASDALPLIPPLKSVTSIRYGKGAFNAQLEYEFAGAQSHVSKLAEESSTKSYSIIHLRTGYKLKSSWTVNVGAENIFNSRYREHLDWGNIMRPGRNFYLNVNYRF